MVTFDRLVIIVSSCDAFSDCWEPLLFSFRKFWPDCPYKRYLVTNTHSIQEQYGGFEFVAVGQDKGWASNLQEALALISPVTPYFLYFQDDFWLNGALETSFIEPQLDYMDENSLDYLRLTCPWMDKYRKDATHAISPIVKEPYALCLSASIWRLDSFSRLLIPGWTGWEFEAKVASLGVENYCSEVLLESESRTHFPIIGLAGGAVRKGRWTRDAKRYLKKYRFQRLMSLRETEGFIYTTILALMRFNKYFYKLLDPVIMWMHRRHLNV